jgi:hypothetical protein
MFDGSYLWFFSKRYEKSNCLFNMQPTRIYFKFICQKEKLPKGFPVVQKKSCVLRVYNTNLNKI